MTRTHSPRHGALLLFGLVVLSLMALPSRGYDRTLRAGDLVLHFRTSAISNLVHHLESLAGSGSQRAYQDLWRRTLRWDPTDQRMIEEWKSVRARYVEAQFAIADPRAEPSVLPLGFNGIDLWNRVRIAGLGAASTEDYLNQVGLLLTLSDAAIIRRILNHFQPRFERWWNRTGERQAIAFGDAAIVLVRQKKLDDLLADVKSFYASELPGVTPVHFNLLVRPRGQGQDTHSEQIENYAAIELLEGTRPEEQLDVVMHELFHFFFATASPSRRAHLAAAFSQAPDDDAIAKFNLMDEALATAFGNGLVGEQLVTPDRFAHLLSKSNGFYNDTDIDRSAKGLLPLCREWLGHHGTLYDPEFIPAYLAVLKQALGNDAGAIRNYLRRMVLITPNPQSGEAAETLTAGLHAGSVYTTESLAQARSRLEQYPYLSGVLLIRTADLPQLSAWKGLLPLAVEKELSDAAGSGTAVMYGVQRNSKSYVFILCAKDAPELLACTRNFLGMTGQPPFIGRH